MQPNIGLFRGGSRFEVCHMIVESLVAVGLGASAKRGENISIAVVAGSEWHWIWYLGLRHGWRGGMVMGIQAYRLMYTGCVCQV